MENPFLRFNKSNNTLKILLVCLVLILSLTVIFANKSISNAFDSVNTYKEMMLNSPEKQRIKKLEDDLKKKETELKKLTATKTAIENHINSKNGSLSNRTVDIYAATIMKESSKRNVSPYIVTSVIGTESSFKSDPKHIRSNIITGMSGIYWDMWADDLRKEGIAYSRKDLKNPIVSIKACAYVVSVYTKQYNTTLTALGRYKGWSKLGISQASNVIRVAQSIKYEAKKLI